MRALCHSSPTSHSNSKLLAAGGSNQPILSFGGDEEDVKDDDGDATEDPVVDLLGPSSDAPEAEDSGNDDDDEEGADGEPEDDFNAAWEVLDLARAIYLKTEAEDDKVKLKLADTYIALGDVSLETGMLYTNCVLDLNS